MLLFVLGVLIPFYTREPRVKIGDNYIYCNPGAKIKPKKTYHLRIWDYDWPFKSGNQGYKQYLEQAIVEFQQLYPNVKVEITLLDLLNGPSQLEQALKTNTAPDVYCSAYTMPKFHFKRQIPVGPYLKRKEKEIYFSDLVDLLNYKDVMCYFPRWVAPGLWIGNRNLIEKMGLSVAKIQKQGWTWEDLEDVSKRINAGNYLLVGNLGLNGLFSQLAVNGGTAPITGNTPLLLKSDIAITVNFLSGLLKRNSIPLDCERNMMRRFLEGKTMLLAGVKPLMHRYLVDKLAVANSDWSPVFIPIPARIPGKEYLIIENGVICVYRNKRTAGDDHLTAAVRLGQFLSCYPKVSPWEQLMVLPASKEAFKIWLSQHGFDNELFSNLLQKSIILNSGPPSVLPDRLSPILNEFIGGKINEETLKIKLAEELL